MNKDIFGQELFVGDYLVLPGRGSSSSWLDFARVVALKKNRIDIVKSHGNYIGARKSYTSMAHKGFRVDARSMPEVIKNELDRQYEDARAASKGTVC